MVTEVAILEIKRGTQADFELAFAKAELVISRAEGYLSHSMQRCLETETKYLLLVQWTSLEAHTTGFRQSALFTEWRALIGPFFDKAPVVEHYETLNA
ncbi:antibiotic biosynthesis monooxygenase family protein [Spirosoma arcticum]